MTDTEPTSGYMPGRRWEIRILIVLVALLLSRAAVSYAGLENPNNNGEYSGIGFISGWKCEADGALTARINGGEAIPLAYLNDRPDTLSVCGDTDNGFIAIVNWARYGTGAHTIEVFDNGVRFGQHAFDVTTLGTEFLRGAPDEQFLLRDWPWSGDVTRITWNEALQTFVLIDYIPATPPDELCTTKTVTVWHARSMMSAIMTITNPCDGDTLDIDITARGPEEFNVCGSSWYHLPSVYQNGGVFGYHDGLRWRDRDTHHLVCSDGNIPPGVTKHTRLTFDEADKTDGGSPYNLTFLQPFGLDSISFEHFLTDPETGERISHLSFGGHR